MFWFFGLEVREFLAPQSGMEPTPLSLKGEGLTTEPPGRFPPPFPGGSDSKESACNAGDLDLIPGSGRVPGEGNGYPLQYSCLENSMDRGDWQVTVHGVAKSWTILSDFHFLFHLYLNTSWNITLLTKVHTVKAIVFLVVMYRFESGIIKKAECQRIDALEL